MKERAAQGEVLRGEREGDVVGAEEVGQDRRRRAAERAVARGVRGERAACRSSGVQPGSAAVSGLPSFVGLADGGDRPPEVVVVLGVPADDGGVGHGDVEQRRTAGRSRPGELPAPRPPLGDLVPVARRRGGAGAVGPEPGDLASGRPCARCWCGAPSASTSSDGGRVLRAVKRRRGGGAELRRRVMANGVTPGPLRQQGRGMKPAASAATGRSPRRVGAGVYATVRVRRLGSASARMASADGAAQRDARGPCPARRARCQDSARAASNRATARLGYSSTSGRGAPPPPPRPPADVRRGTVGEVGVWRPVDRVDGVVDGGVHHRQVTGGQRGATTSRP